MLKPGTGSHPIPGFSSPLFSACVAAVKSRPVLHHCVVIFFWSSGIMECTCSLHVCCLHLKIEFRSCARGRPWCGIIHYYWRTASIKPRLLFSRAGYASWGLSLSSVKFTFQYNFKDSNACVTFLFFHGHVKTQFSRTKYKSKINKAMFDCVCIILIMTLKGARAQKIGLKRGP